MPPRICGDRMTSGRSGRRDLGSIERCKDRLIAEMTGRIGRHLQHSLCVDEFGVPSDRRIGISRKTLRCRSALRPDSSSKER